MTTPFRKTSRSSLLCCLVLTLMVFTLLASVPASATPPAAFTTFDTTTLGCLDGKHPNGIDCNNYAAKEDVYVNGGPGGLGGLSSGSYYFVVLVPGFQNGGFIDGANGNLSDITKSNDSKSDPLEAGAGSGDDVSNRTFTVSGGVVTYSGTHALGTDPNGDSVIQLFPYDDTTNMGGVYILGICLTGATSDSQCKFDAFRIKTAPPPPPPGGPTQATIEACKFWDVDLEHQYDPNPPASDPFIGAWPLTATITGGDSQAYIGTTVGATSATQDTDNTTGGNPLAPGPSFGCTTFTVTWPTGDTSPTAVNLSFSEGSQPDSGSQSCDMVALTCQATLAGNWQQSAPYAFTAFGSCSAGSVCDSLDDTTLNPNDNTSVPYPFGNFIGQDLTVTKTATPSFTREYSWSIVKSLYSPTGNPVEESGSSVTITYKVTATETGFTDSLWQVTGNITTTNPNAFAVTGVTVTDTVDDGGTCTVDPNATLGLNETIPANGSLTLPYVCTYSAQPAYTLATNTAKAAWDATTFATPHSFATGQATFTFNDGTTGNPTRVNYKVTVTDTFNGGSPSPLGTLYAVDTCTGLTPTCTTNTYTVTEKVTVPAGTCATFSNTATVAGDDFSITTSPVTVNICNEQTGALTMGFWQNKNGQGIISGQAKSGACPSAAWLTLLDPFTDLSSTATCSTVATYVKNVIGAAQCSTDALSGTPKNTATCNYMLKAQMLATALDVYFSDPTLGGNKIGAPGPIGGVKINLTKVCVMIDGSGGTATCSGTYTNASSVFGGATSLTVAAILSYENTVGTNGSPNYSNQSLFPDVNTGAYAGLIWWYNQNKANQVLAKNVFDAINNQVAQIAP